MSFCTTRLVLLMLRISMLSQTFFGRDLILLVFD